MNNNVGDLVKEKKKINKALFLINQKPILKISSNLNNI